MKGRPRHFSSCPDCSQPIRSSHSPYYKCGCRGYILREGKLNPTRPRGKPLKRTSEQVVRDGVSMTADEYEELCN